MHMISKGQIVGCDTKLLDWLRNHRPTLDLFTRLSTFSSTRASVHDDRLISAALVAEADRIIIEKGLAGVGYAKSAVITAIESPFENSVFVSYHRF